MMRITDTVKHLLIINVVFFIGTLTIGKEGVFYDWFAMHFPKNEAFQPWQIFTHMFMHGDEYHILFNMLGLWIFGSPIENYFGGKRFLFLYLSAGLGALILQLAQYYINFYSAYQSIADLNMSGELLSRIVSINAIEGNLIKGELLSEQMFPILNEYGFNLNLINKESFKALFDMNVISQTIMMGASGCVMGLLASIAYLSPNTEILIFPLPIAIKLKYLAVGMIGSDFLSGLLTGTPLLAHSNVGHFAHVGGALTGLFIAWYWRKNQFNKNRWD